MDYIQEPAWIVDGKLDEVNFAKFMLDYKKMVYAEGSFFTTEGRLQNEEWLRREIYLFIRDYVSTNVSRKVENILAVMRMECAQEMPYDEYTLHMANGTYHLIDGFSTKRYICRRRLPVEYNPHASTPERWLSFLDELLEPEDIPTLQEFMGYCLIPVNLGQKMLIITGRGGEGKSRIGYVMKQLLGDGMNFGSIAKVETNAFARADLEHKLLMVDDDLRLTRLPTTNNLKSLITAEMPVDLERKGKQSYQGMMYARFMAFGNGTLQAENDNSFGFYRRQIILNAKPKDPMRVDDPYLAMKLKEEIEGIFLWCLQGLYRLVDKDFRFHLSKAARENTAQAMSLSNNIPLFMASEGYFVKDENAMVTTRQLYDAYRQWCADNTCHSMGMYTFSASIKQDAQYYGLQYDSNVPSESGKRVRGFRGIRLVHAGERDRE